MLSWKRLFLRQFAEGEFAEKSIGAGVGGNFLDLRDNSFRRAADERTLGDGVLHVHQLLAAAAVENRR